MDDHPRPPRPDAPAGPPLPDGARPDTPDIPRPDTPLPDTPLPDAARDALARPPAGLNWASGSSIRRAGSARRRHHRAGGLAAVLAVVAAVAIVATTLASGGRDHPVAVEKVPVGDGATHLVATAAPSRAGARQQTTVTGDEVAFALALTRQLAGGAAADADTVDSPLSAALALSMLELGAAGSTQSGIARALQSSGLTASAQAAAWAALQSSLASTGKDGTLQLANSLWIQSGWPVRPAYLGDVAADYRDPVYQVDFATPAHLAAAVAAINAWVRAETAGHLATLFPPGSLDTSTVMVLANALHFAARWGVHMASTTEPFELPSGSGEVVPAIKTVAPLDYSVTGTTTAVAVPYAGDRYEAVVVEPTRGTLGSALDHLSAGALGAVLNGMHAGTVDLTLPTVDLHADQSLEGALADLGMQQAFGPGADFLPISRQDPSVETVEQADLLQVDRAGTQAAAATGIGMTDTAVAVPLRERVIDIDRPYLLLIRDTRTGTILMAAAVNDPAAS